MNTCKICKNPCKNTQTVHDGCVTKEYAKTFNVPVICTHEGLKLKQNLSKNEIEYCLQYVNQEAANEFNKEIGLTA
jgi:hypothetical protein